MDDREAAQILRDALDGSVRTGEVDRSRLARGSARRLTTLRRRRTAGRAAAALVLVAAVPVTISVLPGGPVRTVPAAPPTQTSPTQTSPTQTSPTQTSPTQALPTTVPSATPTRTQPAEVLGPDGPQTEGDSPGSSLANPDFPVDYFVPDMAQAAAAMPADLQLLADFGQYPKQPTVPGQECSSRPFDPPQVAGRQFSWAQENSNRLDQEEVELVVTGWQSGGGPTAFDAVVTASGVCRFTERTTPIDLAVEGADATWAARTDQNGLVRFSAAARTGDLLVGVSVLNPREDGPTELGRVLTAAVADLRVSGLSAVDGS